jgi:hypothetical protein
MLPKENNNEGNSNFLLNIGWFEFPHVLCVFYLHLHVYLKAHLCYGIPKKDLDDYKKPTLGFN